MWTYTIIVVPIMHRNELSVIHILFDLWAISTNYISLSFQTSIAISLPLLLKSPIFRNRQRYLRGTMHYTEQHANESQTSWTSLLPTKK